jgi:signal transduction histidine kinase
LWICVLILVETSSFFEIIDLKLNSLEVSFFIFTFTSKRQKKSKCMSKNIAAIIVSILLLNNLSFSQNRNSIDSLRSVLGKTKTDSTKVKTLNTLSREFWKSGLLDSALNRANQSVKLATNINFLSGLAEANSNRGIANDLLGKYPLALKHFFASLRIFEKINDKVGVGNIYSNIAVIHGKQGDLDQAEKYTLKALKIYEKIENGVERQMTNCYNNMGNINLERRNFTKAIEYFNKAILRFEAIDYMYGKAKCLNNIGTAYKYQNDFVNAEKYYNQARDLQVKIGDKNGLAITLDGLSIVYLKTKQLVKAKKNLTKEMALAFEIGSMDEIKNSFFNQSVYDSIIGNYEGALVNYKKFILYRDSIINVENTQASIEQAVQFEYDKKRVSDSLQNANEKAIVNLQLDKEKSQRNYLYIIIIITLLSTVFIFNRFRLSQKQKATIEKSNKELERLNVLNQKIFSIISHDFKGPITTLKSLLARNELLSIENPLVNLYVKDISTQLEQSDQMLESLLDWAKAELSFSFSKNETNILSAVNEVLIQVDSQLKTKSLNVKLDIDPYFDIRLPSDVLKIVVRNLLTNAIKYSSENKTITINANQNTIKISDQGIGIDDKKLSLLFKKQVASSLGTNLETGFGLGLYMCNELLHKNNGKLIAYNNENGVGCTFELTVNS